MSGELARLTNARGEVRTAVLKAVLAELDVTADFTERFDAWEAVDKAAGRLTGARRRYSKHVREVADRAATARAAAS